MSLCYSALLCIRRKTLHARGALIHFSHWVSCVIQQAKLVYSHCGAWFFLQGKPVKVPITDDTIVPIHWNHAVSFYYSLTINKGNKVLHSFWVAHFQLTVMNISKQEGGASLIVYKWWHWAGFGEGNKSWMWLITNTGENSSFFCHIRCFHSHGSFWTEAGI